jgi:putative MATE family efflux protein
MVVGYSAMTAFRAAEIFFVSQLGDAPLAAISFTFPVVWLMTSVIIGFESGTASCISRAIGNKNIEMARRQTTDTVVLVALSTCILCALGYFAIEPMFRLLGATDDVLPLIHDYMSIWFLSQPAYALMWVCLASMRARGNSLLEGKVVSISSLLNAVLCPVFVFGWFGMPRLEIAGAAWATLVTNLIIIVATLAFLHFRLRVFATPIAAFTTILASWKRTLHVGLPSMATYAIAPISSAIVVAMVASFGVEAVAGFGIAMRIEPIVLLAFYALSAITSPFFGQNYASGSLERVKEARLVIARFCVGFGLVAALVLALVALPLARQFSVNEQIVAVAAQYLWIMAISYGGMGMAMIYCSAFNGMGYPTPALIISALRTFIVFIPLALAGQALFGLGGIFAASAATNIGIGVIGFVWLGRKIGVEPQFLK